MKKVLGFGCLGVVVLVVIGIIAAVASAGSHSDNTHGPGDSAATTAPAASAKQPAATAKPPASTGHTVVYSAENSDGATMLVTYGLGADQSQVNGAPSPWSKTATTNDALVIASLVVQSQGSGTVSCKITKDGKVVKTNSSQGQYAVVTCSSS